VADIEGIISNAIADLPDRGDDGGGDTTETVDTSAEATTEVADEAGLADPAATDGDPAADPTGDDPPVVAAPVKKFPKHVPWARFDAQQKAKVEAEAKAAAIQAKHDEIAAKHDALDRTLRAFEDEGQIDKLADVLLSNPLWASRLTRAQKQEIKAAAANAAPAAAAPASDALPPVPEADIELSDGSRTWSPEAFSKYVADVAAHAAGAARREAEEKFTALESRLKPFEEKVENEKQVDARASSYNAELEALYEPYGKDFVLEHKDAMFAWLRDQWGNPDRKTWRPTTPVKNAKATLRNAEYAVLKQAERAKYEKGRSDALSAADQARARVISDANTRAAAAERPATAATPPAPASGNRSIEDVIKASMRKAGISSAA
jgi:hypothetical protein